jgi:GTP pyrophosphokinase
VIEKIAKRMNYASATDLFAAIGFGDASAVSVVTKLKDEAKATNNLIDISALQRPAVPPRRVARNSSGIRIAGVDDVLVRLSKCCSPVPGDPIMGYVTIGKGVSVHRADCPNVAYMTATPERILHASWADIESQTHSVDVEIEALDRAGLLQDVMGVCSEYKTSASAVTARVKRDKIAVISLTLQISNLDHLHKVMEKLRLLRDVRTVYRVTKREARASG